MKLAIFDFDGTLFPKDTLPYLLKQWYQLNYPKDKLFKIIIPLLPTYLKYKINKKASTNARDDMRLKAVYGFNKLLTGMSKEEIKDFFQLSSAAIQKHLNPAVVEKVIQAQNKGYHTVLLSGAYCLFLKYIADYLNIDTVIGTEIYFDKGIFHNNVSPDIVSGASKVDKLKAYFKDKNVNWRESLAFADSIIDLKVLELVGNPTAVCPDPVLRKIAEEKKWEII